MVQSWQVLLLLVCLQWGKTRLCTLRHSLFRDLRYGPARAHLCDLPWRRDEKAQGIESVTAMEEETTVSRGAEHSESQRCKRQDEVHPCSRRVGRQRPPETWVGDTMLLAPALFPHRAEQGVPGSRLAGIPRVLLNPYRRNQGRWPGGRVQTWFSSTCKLKPLLKLGITRDHQGSAWGWIS